MKRLLLLIAVCVLASVASSLDAQRGGGAAVPAVRRVSPRRRRQSISPATGCRRSSRTGSTGWSRPTKGVFDAVPLNPEGRKVGESWDPAKDEAAGEQCRAYGAGGIMRLPGRLRISWQDDTTLKVETDTGTQTRLLRFGNAACSHRGDLAGTFGGAVERGRAQSQGGHHAPASRLRPQERRALQREGDRHRVPGT